MVVTAEGLYSTGLGFVGSEDYAKALPYFEEAVQRNPSYAEAWFEVGVCNGELGRHQEEIAAYQQAIRLKPDFARAYYNLGLAYGELGRYQEEITAFQQAIHLKPDFAEAHYNLGGVYGKLGHYQEAVAAFQQAIRLKPDYAEAHINLGAAVRTFPCAATRTLSLPNTLPKSLRHDATVKRQKSPVTPG